MIKITNSSVRNVEQLAKNHVSELKPIVINKINKTKTLRNGIKKFITEHVDVLLGGKPHELLVTTEKFADECGHYKNPNRGLKNVFSYSKFRDEKILYGAYKLALGLNVPVCVYCNRQYTFTLIKGNRTITRPELDHFFSQNDYPLLSLSFYNLIPSCSICNSRLKGRVEFNLTEYVHPYLQGFDNDMQFDYLPLSSAAAEGKSIELEINTEIKTTEPFIRNQINGNLTIFHTKDLYQGHADVVAEIIRKRFATSDRYLEILEKTFVDFATKEELYQIAFGNYFKEEDFCKRTLAKLTSDIVKSQIKKFPSS